MVIEKELAQERKARQEVEGKIEDLAQGLSQLNTMLKNLQVGTTKEEASFADNSVSRPASEQFPVNSTQKLKNMERLLTSCTMSAGIWLKQRKGDGSADLTTVPVLSRTLFEKANTVTPPSSEGFTSDSFDSETSGSARNSDVESLGTEDIVQGSDLGAIFREGFYS
jgi:hypothetical protein